MSRRAASKAARAKIRTHPEMVRLAGKLGIKPWRQTEKELILAAVKRSDGDLPLAAQLLKVSRSTLDRKLKTYSRAGA